MLKRKIDQLPVTKKGALYGVITSGEIVFNLMPKTDRKNTADALGNRYDEPLGNFAAGTSSPTRSRTLSGTSTRTCQERRELLCHHGHRRNPGHGHLRDFLRVMAKKATESSIPMYIVGLPDDPFEAGTARKKFLGAVELLRRSVPDISEARAIIKMGETKSPEEKVRGEGLPRTPQGPLLVQRPLVTSSQTPSTRSTTG